MADVRRYASLLDISEGAAARLGERRVLALRTDAGVEHAWSAVDLVRRGKLAAWRLQAAGVRRGDRLILWSPSTPEIAALFFGAMRVGAAIVPIDLRMTAAVVDGIVRNSGARWLVTGGSGTAAGLEPQGTTLATLGRLALSDLASGAEPSVAGDWEAQVDTWPRPTREDLFLIGFTSGTGGTPKGVAIRHGNFLSTIEAARGVYPRFHHRFVSLLPLSHAFGQLELMHVLNLSGEILYVQSRNPRLVFEAMREHHVTSMHVVPQMLELFWSAILRGVEERGEGATFAEQRRAARSLSYPARRHLFASLHRSLGGNLRMFYCTAAFLPSSLQEAWEELGIVVIQGYGTTESGLATSTSHREHPPGSVGRARQPTRLELAADGEVLVSGPTVCAGYIDESGETPSVDELGRYHTGDIGQLGADGNLTLLGRKQNVIVLPNGLNVFPEEIENALRGAGIRESVVVETEPGRIEAVVAEVLDVDGPSAARVRIDARVRSANASLAVHQRIDAWRLWPEADFPRTHTLKVRRDPVRQWVSGSSVVPLPVREESPPG